MAFAFVGHLAGIVLTIFAWNFWSLYCGTLIFGIANGSVEAACNPLITTLFPNDKTTKLNHFHVWFPGGIVIGGVLAYLLEKVGFGWKTEFATMLIPLVAYGILFMGQPFPKTERVQQGISYGSMLKACVHPLFLLMVACMFMTASTELGSTTWIPNILTSAGVPGILVLAWINGLMAVGRSFAGTFVHKLSPLGMLLVSSVLSAIGLYSMSHAAGTVLYVGATVFALGVCFFWPTMLGFVNERFPSTGAMGLAIMGGCGMLSVSFVLPVLGKYFDDGSPRGSPPGRRSRRSRQRRMGRTWRSTGSRFRRPRASRCWAASPSFRSSCSSSSSSSTWRGRRPRRTKTDDPTPSPGRPATRSSRRPGS
jgi:predicted MFS family arabinose efflux permease